MVPSAKLMAREFERNFIPLILHLTNDPVLIWRGLVHLAVAGKCFPIIRRWSTVESYSVGDLWAWAWIKKVKIVYIMYLWNHILCVLMILFFVIHARLQSKPQGSRQGLGYKRYIFEHGNNVSGRGFTGSNNPSQSILVIPPTLPSFVRAICYRPGSEDVPLFRDMR